MMIEVVRIVRDALADAGTGVNAVLQSVISLDGTDTLPSPLVAFKNVADDDLGIREEDLSVPFLVIDVRSDSTMQGYATSGVRDGTVIVTVGYVTKGGSTAKNFRDTDYTLRAIAKVLHKSLWQLDAARKRNNIAIKNSPSMILQKVEQESWGGMMTGIATITFNVRDLSP